MTFLRVWIRVTVLDLVYKLHCEGADRACAHGTANSHTWQLAHLMLHTVFRATLADKYHKRVQTVEQVVHQTSEGENSILITSKMAITC